MSKHRVLKIALPLTSLAFLASQAFAGQWPVFDYIKLTPTGIPSTIIVESENNSTWTRIRPSQILMSGVVDIKMDNAWCENCYTLGW